MRSRTNCPRAVQKSPAPSIEAIDEINEEETAKIEISKLLVIRRITSNSDMSKLLMTIFEEWNNVDAITNTIDSKYMNEE
jgi:hypothetical protein